MIQSLEDTAKRSVVRGPQVASRAQVGSGPWRALSLDFPAGQGSCRALECCLTWAGIMCRADLGQWGKEVGVTFLFLGWSLGRASEAQCLQAKRELTALSPPAWLRPIPGE